MKKNNLSVPEPTDNLLQSHRFRLSFLYAVPIGVLGGLIGLGGAEFRLPVLASILSYSARQAVPLNLAGVKVAKTLLANSENTYAKLINERDEMIECLLGSFVPRSLFA